MSTTKEELYSIADTIERNGGWHIAALKVRDAADEIEQWREKYLRVLSERDEARKDCMNFKLHGNIMGEQA